MTKIRRILIKWLAGSMPVALNIKHHSDGLDMGPSASISENITWREWGLFE